MKMPLPTPLLDDRRFQDIVDQAKTLIPQYCPEWTDHNVSDPGVTLIELFAWMTDMLLYRVNQVPDKAYIKFLELIGVQLNPPRAARAPVTFYLSAAQSTQLAIPTGTEVATVRTETSPAIVFTTEADLTIRPPTPIGLFTRNASREGPTAWTVHDLRDLDITGRRISIFPSQPGPRDAFYVGLQADHSYHVLALVLECDEAGGRGVDPKHPPLRWQAWQGGVGRWAACDVEYDGTGGFNWSGEVILHLPQMAQEEFQGLRAYWVRCQLTDAQAGSTGYQVSPALRGLRVEARGGTVGARHAVTVRDEQLGMSDGTPGQHFALLHAPLLSRDPMTDYLSVTAVNGQPEPWTEVTDFGDSTETDQHYTLDSQDGTVTLGPSLLQPDGSVYRFGAVPPRGSALRFTRYQYGGGLAGNVPVGALSVLKSSIPYVSQVVNRAPALGGRDPQSLEDAKLRAPQTLRTRTRAVTADDYEYLARQVPGVARACCLAPGAQPGSAADPRPGQVVVIVLPGDGVSQQSRDPATVQTWIPAERLTFSAELQTAVTAYLDERRPLGITLEVRPPQYIWIGISATLRLPPRSDSALLGAVKQRAEAVLYEYLNPFVGGPRGDGWPFGRELYQSEIYSLLQRVPHVEFVEEVRIRVGEQEGSAAASEAPARLALPRHGVICSDQHHVEVRAN
jgi:predicted phage baseplate assembly protein